MRLIACLEAQKKNPFERTLAWTRRRGLTTSLPQLAHLSFWVLLILATRIFHPSKERASSQSSRGACSLPSQSILPRRYGSSLGLRRCRRTNRLSLLSRRCRELSSLRRNE